MVKCVNYLDLNDAETLLVSAGGKANIKIWKVIYDSPSSSSNQVQRIIQLYEFKRFFKRNQKTTSPSKNEKPWLFIDLKSNPEIRFMDVCLFYDSNQHIILCFACSDAFVR